MSTAVPWADILNAATLAASALPQPVGAVASIALAIARSLVDDGCAIDGCPAHLVEVLQPADVPTGEKGLDAFARLTARAAGLDARGIADRKRWREGLLAVAARKGEAMKSKVSQILDEAERTS